LEYCKVLLENRMIVNSTIFVQNSRQHEAAIFYKTAFSPKSLKEHTHRGELIAIDIMLQGLAISVAGSNPRRETEPWRGGPFFPKAPGSVSSVIRLDVKNAASLVAAAKAAGATEREELQIDAEGHKVAVIFDPFGHVWAIRERDKANGRVAA
jgi:PhnB protein